MYSNNNCYYINILYQKMTYKIKKLSKVTAAGAEKECLFSEVLNASVSYILCHNIEIIFLAYVSAIFSHSHLHSKEINPFAFAFL